MDFNELCGRIGFIILFISLAIILVMLIIIPFDYLEKFIGKYIIVVLLFIIALIVNQLYPWSK